MNAPVFYGRRGMAPPSLTPMKRRKWRSLFGAALDLDFTKSKHNQLLGPETVTNGDFAANINSWTAYGSAGGNAAGVVWDATGKLSITGTGTGLTGAWQALTTVVGATYEVSATATSQPINIVISTGSAAGGTGITSPQITAGQTLTLRFTAITTTTYITFNRGSASASLVDNVSVREVNPPLERLLTTTRASVGMAQHADGTWQEYPAGVPRLTTKGLFVEEARTQSLRNSAMAGASVGSNTLPTNWSNTLLGMTRTVVAVGTDSGLDSIDIRFSGTPTSTGTASIDFDGTTVAAAASGQAWTFSVFLKLLAGTVSALTVTVLERDAGGALLGSSNTGVSATTAWQRGSHTRTLNQPTTAFVSTRLAFTVTQDVPVDFTIRIGLPQLEQGAFATSPIRSTGSAVTRALDQVSLQGLAWLSDQVGTFFAQWNSRPSIFTTNGALWTISDGSNNNRIGAYVLIDGTAVSRLVNATAQQEPTPAGSFVNNALNRHAVRYGVGADAAGHALNGAAVVVSSPTVLPAKATYNGRLDLGSFNAALPLNGYLERLVHWNVAQSSANLVRLSLGQDVDPGSWALAGATIDLDFANDRYFGQHRNQLAFTRASAGMAVDSSGVWQSFSANQLRLTDLGITIEEARTQLVTNSAMVGAAVPSTVPTAWAVLPGTSGLTPQIVGLGTEKGLDYIDLRVSGTLNATGAVTAWEFLSTATAVSPAQVYATSFFAKLVAGSWNGVALVQVALAAWQADGATVTLNSTSAIVPDATLRRYEVSSTLPALSALARPRVRFQWGTTGQAVDFTLRIAAPQLELGSFATSPIRSTGAQTARAADIIGLSPAMVALMAGAAGTMFFKFRRDAAISGTEFPRLIDSYGANASVNVHNLFLYSAGVPRVRQNDIDASAVTSAIDTTGNGLTLGVSNKVAAGWDAAALTVSLNGQNQAANSTARTPSVPTQGWLGNRGDAARGLNGFLERVALYPTRLISTDLQAVST